MRDIHIGISVVIPTYNRADAATNANRGETLVKAVNSVLAQTHRDFEIVVVDDCSDKPAAEILAEAGIKNSRLHIVRHDHNQGQAAARNTGAREAQGKWLAFLDDDDLFHPTKLADQRRYMHLNGLKASVTDFTLPGDVHLYSLIRNSQQDPNAWLIPTGRFLALPSTLMIKKDVFDKMGGFDEDRELRRVEDFAFMLKLHKHGEKLGVVPKYLSHYSGFHPANPDFETRALEALERKYGDIFPEGSKARGRFAAAMEWKKTHFRLSGKPLLARVAKIAELTARNPWRIAGIAASVAENPLHHLVPPSDRPRTGLPSDRTLPDPCVPL